MKLKHRPRSGRTGFTLVELLVVMTIIAVLVSLTAAAVFKLLGKGQETQRRSDISQLGAALGSAKAAFGLDQQFPSQLMLAEDGNYPTTPLALDSQAFLMKMFKMTSPSQLKNIDWNGNGTIDKGVVVTLTGDQCLVFFLGGIVTGSPPTPQGFSTQTGNPVVGVDRYGPYFKFQPARLVKGGNGFWSYLDPYNAQPYAYFSSYKRRNGYNRYGVSDCGNVVAPYIKSTNPLTFWNEDSFQIISAGPDQAFGPGNTVDKTGNPTGTPWGPNNPNTGVGDDDMSNFHDRTLGAVD